LSPAARWSGKHDDGNIQRLASTQFLEPLLLLIDKILQHSVRNVERKIIHQRANVR
jgi:hypothetical protein